MTIAIRNDYFGNEPSATFIDVNEAVKYIQTNPSYEIIPEGRLRPYGDIDGNAPETITDMDFWENNTSLIASIDHQFSTIGERVVIYTSSSYEIKKYSIRWVLPEIICETRKAVRILAEKLYNQLEFPDGVKGDLSVYSGGRKMRCVGTSKPNENRPLELLFENDEIQDTLISYLPTTAHEIVIHIPEERKSQFQEPADETELTRICDAISIERWTDYNTCMRMIFAMCSAGASPSLIHFYCAKATNYGEKWVNDLIRNWNASHSPTIATLVYYAKMDDPSFRTKSSGNRNYFEEITQLTTTDNTLFNHHTHNGFLKELPYHRTQAVKSQMGTGKSTEMKRLSKYETKVLLISCRRTYTATFKKELNFADYQDFQKDKTMEKLRNSPKLIISVQSIHKLAGCVYDLILLDECETICATLSPNQTHQKKYIENIEAFEKLLKSAKRVVGLDAFLTDRTTRMLEELRGEVQIIINPKHPFNKTCKIYKSEKDFITTLNHKIKGDDKRCISFWGSKEKAVNYHSLNGGTCYTGSTEKLNNIHFSNPNEYWSKEKHIGYTSCVTIGINYTAEPHFDFASFSFSAFSSSPRDVIQALHRARTLNDNHLIGYLNTKSPPHYSLVETGIENQEQMFNEETNRKRKFLEGIGENPENLSNIPKWLKHILIWNRNEKVVSAKNVEEVFIGYLGLCGITTEMIDGENTRTQNEKKEYPDISTIREIGHEEADILMKSRKGIDEDQRLELELYLLKCKVDYVNQDIWEIWLKDNRWIKRTWIQQNSNAEFVIKADHNKYIELVPKEAEQLKVIQSFEFDWTNSWTISIEEIKQISLEPFNLRKRTEKDTQEQYARDVSKVFKYWNGTELKVVRKQTKKDKEYIEKFLLTYSNLNPLYSAVSKINVF